jgi:hypothetical protein
VGRTLLPFINVGEDVSVGEGALVSQASAETFGAGDPAFVLIDFDEGTTAEEMTAELEQRRLVPGGFGILLGPQLPGDLVSYSRISNTPLLLAGLLGLLGAGVLLHTLAASAVRRRGDSAVLRALGMRRRSVGATVVWQSLTLVVATLLLGLPTGVLVGRLLWQGFANGLGVVPDPVVPLLGLAATAGVALLLSVALAIVPARSAARRSPAADLAAD